MRRSPRLLSSLILAVAGPATLAHTPYLAPNAFEPINGGLITLDASFAEHFFVPEVVFDDSTLEVRQPDGTTVTPDLVQPLKTRLAIEHELHEDGTYRFSTGRRIGRVFMLYELGGETHALEDAEAQLPEGAKLLDHYQSNTIAETYVSRGAPTDTVLAPRGDGLEYQMLSHPNDLFAVEPLQMRALFFGEPLPDLVVDVFEAGHGSADDAPIAILTSDAEGEFTFIPAIGGVYLLRSRYRAASVEGMQAPETSHTYTLVVEAADGVLEQIP